MSQDPPGYLAYYRKSKGRAGIARQRAATTAYVAHLGGVIIAEYTDTDSTAFALPGQPPPPRKDFARLLADLPRHPGVSIAAWHADRLLRNEEDTAELSRACINGGHLIVTKSGGTYDLSMANGRRRLRDDASAAQYEVDHNRERMLEKRAEMAAEGRWPGGRRPFGWAIDKESPGGLVLDLAEAPELARMHAQVLDHASLHSVARGLNDRGRRTAGGGQWKSTDVRRALLRPMNWAPPPAAWPAIVDEETHRKVVAILNRPDRRTTPGPARAHLLSGIALCGRCGWGLVCSSVGSGRKARFTYRCPKARGGGHVARDAAALDKAITRLVTGYLSLPEVRKRMKPKTGSVATLHRERTAIEEDMRSSNELRRQKLLTAAEFAVDRAEHLQRLAAVDARIAAAEETDVVAPLLADPAAVWESLSLDRQRAVISALMYITVFPAPKGRPAGWRPGQPYFDTDSVDVRWRR